MEAVLWFFDQDHVGRVITMHERKIGRVEQQTLRELGGRNDTPASQTERQRIVPRASILDDVLANTIARDFAERILNCIVTTSVREGEMSQVSRGSTTTRIHERIQVALRSVWLSGDTLRIEGD